jgi:hypothetical protein
MRSNKTRGVGEIPQNLRPEHIERASRPKDPNIMRPRNIALRGKFSSTVVNATDAAKTPLSANDKRVYLIVQNNGTNDVFINFGNKATVGNIKIIAGGNYEPVVAPVDSISLVCAAGLTSQCAVVEAVEVEVSNAPF